VIATAAGSPCGQLGDKNAILFDGGGLIYLAAWARIDRRWQDGDGG
jgi:hypothetical protein